MAVAWEGYHMFLSPPLESSGGPCVPLTRLTRYCDHQREEKVVDLGNGDSMGGRKGLQD
jgi:hypothetical protein